MFVAGIARAIWPMWLADGLPVPKTRRVIPHKENRLNLQCKEMVV